MMFMRIGQRISRRISGWRYSAPVPVDPPPVDPPVWSAVAGESQITVTTAPTVTAPTATAGENQLAATG